MRFSDRSYQGKVPLIISERPKLTVTLFRTKPYRSNFLQCWLNPSTKTEWAKISVTHKAPWSFLLLKTKSSVISKALCENIPPVFSSPFFSHLEIPKTHYYVVRSGLRALARAVVRKHTQQCTFFYFVVVNLIFPSPFVRGRERCRRTKGAFFEGKSINRGVIAEGPAPADAQNLAIWIGVLKAGFVFLQEI